MRWFAAGVAEVAGCDDDSAAEMVLPKAVDGDACGERIVAMGDPAGQRQPATVGIGRRGFCLRNCWHQGVATAAEHFDEPWFDLLAGRVSIAANEHKTLRRRTVVLTDAEGFAAAGRQLAK